MWKIAIYTCGCWRWLHGVPVLAGDNINYAPITVERVVNLLCAQGGQYTDLVDRFEARVNGRRCLADRV